MTRLVNLASLPVLIITVGCHGPLRITFPQGATEPLFGGLGNHHLEVTTESTLAQQYFDQGLLLRYAFAYEGARRAFEQSAALDPNCAMAWWGVAWSIGPNFWSADVAEENAERGWHAVSRAQALKDHASPLEQRLIDAISKWYAPPPGSDRKRLNQAYADAMSEVWRDYPQDADVGAIYAQSLMALGHGDLWRWDAYTKPNVQAFTAVLEDVLAIDEHHPGGIHYYIHAVRSLFEC